jgi:hypothetical protein
MAAHSAMNKETWPKLLSLVEEGFSVQLDKTPDGCQVTVFAVVGRDHFHTLGESFAEAVNRATAEVSRRGGREGWVGEINLGPTGWDD